MYLTEKALYILLVMLGAVILVCVILLVMYFVRRRTPAASSVSRPSASTADDFLVKVHRSSRASSLSAAGHDGPASTDGEEDIPEDSSRWLPEPVNDNEIMVQMLDDFMQGRLPANVSKLVELKLRERNIEVNPKETAKPSVPQVPVDPSDVDERKKRDGNEKVTPAELSKLEPYLLSEGGDDVLKYYAACRLGFDVEFRFDAKNADEDSRTLASYHERCDSMSDGEFVDYFMYIMNTTEKDPAGSRLKETEVEEEGGAAPCRLSDLELANDRSMRAPLPVYSETEVEEANSEVEQ